MADFSQLKEIGLQFFDAIESTDIDKFVSLFAENGIMQSIQKAKSEIVGQDNIRSLCEQWLRGYKFKYIITDMVAQSNSLLVNTIVSMHRREVCFGQQPTYCDVIQYQTVEFTFNPSNQLEYVIWMYDSKSLDPTIGRAISPTSIKVSKTTPAQQESYKKSAERLLLLFCSGKVDDLLMDVSDDVVMDRFSIHDSSSSKGKQFLHQLLSTWSCAFEMEHVTLSQICEGTKVITRFDLKGKHIGKFMGIESTGQEFLCKNASIMVEFDTSDKICAFVFKYDHSRLIGDIQVA